MSFLRQVLLIMFLYSLSSQSIGQPGVFVSGPMLGHVELRTAAIWVEVKPEVKQVRIRYRKDKTGKESEKLFSYTGKLGQEFNPVTLKIGGLEPDTRYSYTVEALAANTVSTQSGSFRTKELWQWRKPAPDFSFITGSCSYMNEPVYDRPGKPYGGDSSIFLTMAGEPADFMLWLGDNWYTREVDYFSEWGLWYRASHDRSRPIIQPFLKAMPQYAIWDDHDFGPNDMGKEYILKEESRQVFGSYWANPSCGEYGKGTYTKISYADVDIFMLDDRTWRSAERLADSVDGEPNPLKRMFGQQQMDWLKNALRGSAATFKIIATGSQVLNPVSPFDCFRKFPVEYHELIQFIRDEKINGIMFLTGDRHHSEVIKVEGLVPYPLYDITSSPLTSGTHAFGGMEKNNPYRVIGIDQKQNYARITVGGKHKERILTVRYKGLKGELLGEWQVKEQEIRNQ